MDIILKAFQLPRDIQTVIREYGVVQVNQYLICIDNVQRYKRVSVECTLYKTKVLNVNHRKNWKTTVTFSKNIVLEIWVQSDCVKHILRNLANHTIDEFTIN